MMILVNFNKTNLLNKFIGTMYFMMYDVGT